MRKPYEHATKLTDDGLITRTAAQLMELRTELADAVRSITSDPVPRDLLCCLEGKESQQWRMWTWQGHEGYSDNHIRNDKMQRGSPSLCITTPEQKTNQHYDLQHSESCSGYGDSGPTWIIKQAQCLESASDCMILVAFQRAGALFFDLLSHDSWTALWHFYSAKGCSCPKDCSYFSETSCQKQID